MTRRLKELNGKGGKKEGKERKDGASKKENSKK